MIKQFLGKKNFEFVKGFIVRFWFLAVVIIYYLTQNWILGNLILLYMGFRAGNFWDRYKDLVKVQGEAWKQELGLIKNGLHEDDSGS